MPSYRLTISPQAEEDLRAIYVYGLERWGQAKSLAYLEEMKTFIWSLLELPFQGVKRPELKPHLFSKRLESHIVFYRVHIDKIDIARILHARQNAGRHL